MRSYKNSNGEVITVDDVHLETAVLLKMELQNATPSRKCNWRTHQAMMTIEGFDDSDINESYRCMIKDHQKEMGLLSSATKHADLVATNKLESIKQAVGEIYIEKRSNQQVLTQLNRIKRDLATRVLAVEELKDVYANNLDINVPHLTYNPPFMKSESKGVLMVTDWHIGVVVDDCLGNYYNLEIAEKRLNLLKQETIYYCKMFGVTDLNVVGLGDWCEQMYMRPNQSQDCEFGFSMQIVKAQKLIIDLLVSLSEYVNVTYKGIAGNHDRMAGDKAVSHAGDNVNVIINDGIKNVVQAINSERLQFIETSIHDSSIVLDLNGKKIKFVHGDRDNGDKKRRLLGHISMDEVIYDAFVHGHLHNYYVQEDDHGRLIVGVPCLMGRNNYSKDMLCATNAGQAMIVVRGDGTIVPIKIDLQAA
ncbi:putative phosphodiesterase [Paenibacillus sp. LBL]|uniref:hypothetical protein n=1 Tax=Paenibacillus sp. LBL TaxID=2940563 RepID=UPI002472E8AA|nr:hypothetical protein [Paenibacillus sp. LBL]MDH6674420.1 putative phosphodiesterase [Paenibacillus sp. LBL]